EEEEEISNRINATWEGLKADQIKQEEDTRHLSDIHTLEQSNLALNNTEKPPYSNNTQHQDNAPIESTTQNQTSIEPSAPIDNTKRKTSYEDSSQKRPKIDTHESDYWASDMEEELDLDFLSNIHSYF
ncbi:uncharacterized protein B0P05DRAFT_253946, partial [Gilbertella persicaria]|uniref:uncharacterized protein n=1 Tax=Gilbertella persicaria TaxID=101096 RepID=UPI002220A586